MATSGEFRFLEHVGIEVFVFTKSLHFSLHYVVCLIVKVTCLLRCLICCMD